MIFIAYTFKGQVHVFAGRVKIVKSLVLQDKYNIEIFLSPEVLNLLQLCSCSSQLSMSFGLCELMICVPVEKFFGHVRTFPHPLSWVEPVLSR